MKKTATPYIVSKPNGLFQADLFRFTDSLAAKAKHIWHGSIFIQLRHLRHLCRRTRRGAFGSADSAGFSFRRLLTIEETNQRLTAYFFATSLCESPPDKSFFTPSTISSLIGGFDILLSFHDAGRYRSLNDRRFVMPTDFAKRSELCELW